LWTALLGWWGLISLIVTPFLLIYNIFRYLMTLSLPSPPEGALVVSVDEGFRRKLGAAATREIGERLGGGEDLLKVSCELAARYGVTPEEIICYAGTAGTSSRKKSDVIVIEKTPRS
jgi:hypothetical protein